MINWNTSATASIEPEAGRCRPTLSRRPEAGDHLSGDGRHEHHSSEADLAEDPVHDSQCRVGRAVPDWPTSSTVRSPESARSLPDDHQEQQAACDTDP